MNLSCNFSRKKRTKDALVFSIQQSGFGFFGQLVRLLRKFLFCEFEGIGSFIRIANSLKNQRVGVFAIEYKEVGCLRPCPLFSERCTRRIFPGRSETDQPFSSERYTLTLPFDGNKNTFDEKVE
jgi:hypothetical protein